MLSHHLSLTALFVVVLLAAAPSAAAPVSGGESPSVLPLYVPLPPLVFVVCNEQATPATVHLRLPPSGTVVIPDLISSLDLVIPSVVVQWGANQMRTDELAILQHGSIVGGSEVLIEVCL